MKQGRYHVQAMRQLKPRKTLEISLRGFSLGDIRSLHVAEPNLSSNVWMSPRSQETPKLLDQEWKSWCSGCWQACVRPCDASYCLSGAKQKIRRQPVQHDVGPGSLLPHPILRGFKSACRPKCKLRRYPNPAVANQPHGRACSSVRQIVMPATYVQLRWRRGACEALVTPDEPCTQEGR